jgi:hypothetical protein
VVIRPKALASPGFLSPHRYRGFEGARLERGSEFAGADSESNAGIKSTGAAFSNRRLPKTGSLAYCIKA